MKKKGFLERMGCLDVGKVYLRRRESGEESGVINDVKVKTFAGFCFNFFHGCFSFGVSSFIE